MKVLIPCVLVLGLMGGCAGLTADQKARIEALGVENDKAATDMSVLLLKAKSGEASPFEIVQAVDRIKSLMDRNTKEIKEIEASSSTSSTIAALAGLFGRTALHAVSAAIPGAGPIGALLQGILTLLLGGSSNKKKDEGAKVA